MTTDGEFRGWKESGAGGSVLSGAMRLEGYAPSYTPGPGSPSPAAPLDTPAEAVTVVWVRRGYAMLLSGG
jgi:hypothetical protein